MSQQKGHIGVTSDNIFPIIKKFLYSDHEIFLRELVSNAVDASNKLKTLSSVGEFKGELGELKVSVSIDKEAKTVTISDNGIGMTAEEIEKYINQIAFSGAEEFVKKYDSDAGSIIGHFGLGFYSAFMVSKKVEIITLSHNEGAQAVKWSCTGDPEYTIEDSNKTTRGTDIVLHIDDDNQEFLEESRLETLLNKYCKFLTIPVIFGKVKEWKDNAQVDTDQDRQINETHPAWTKKPSELTEEDYKNFYRDLYPGSEEPLFWIHLNVDYPFNLTGILYFPKVKSNMELQRNKIQLYSNQVFVTDSVEGIVPEFLTLLHGVIDSPDIPLNVSRSYLQADGNVKKISNHITKKVADRLQEIFNQERQQYEEKWDSLKVFIQYGILTDEKFEERAKKFLLLQTEDSKLFTLEEYKTLVEADQKDKEGKVVYLYTTDRDAQYSYIEAAKSKGYSVLLMDGQLDTHLAASLEQKLENTHFVRVDSDLIDNIIQKEDRAKSHLTADQTTDMRELFNSQIPTIEKTNFNVVFEAMGESAQPVVITQMEQMRRMKEMAAVNPMYAFMGEMPDSYNLIVNSDHEVCKRILSQEEQACGDTLKPIIEKINSLKQYASDLSTAHGKLKSEEIPTIEKEDLDKTNKEIDQLTAQRSKLLAEYGNQNKLVRQLIDIALLSSGKLKGEALSNFIKRSVDLL
ncbi:MAG: molecular chaperone HtpG [Bacteroidales bacterium]